MLMAPKIRVLLCIPDLEDLGVQHDIRCLMKYWNQDEFEPVMLLHKRQGAFADQFSVDMRSIEVDDYIVDVRGVRILHRVWGYARAFRQFRPHAVISFVPYSNFASVLARRLSGMKFGLAVSEHAHVSASLRDPQSFPGWFGKFYRKWFPHIYNSLTDSVKCIAEESRQDLIKTWGISASQTRLIHDPVDFDEVRKLGDEPCDEPWLQPHLVAEVPTLVNVGRVKGQKRHDLLIRAFALARRDRRLRLIVVGRGSEVEIDALMQLARELGVGDDVKFVGFQRNPWRFMKRASMLVMSSDWEGLPCVLTEAMCLGLPIVSTQCPSGPAEMLVNGAAGLLTPVGEAEPMAAAILSALADPEATANRVKVALDNLYRFAPGPVTRQYEALAIEMAEIGWNRGASRD